MKKSRKVVKGVRMEPDELKRLKPVLKNHQVSFSDFVRLAVSKELNRYGVS